MGLKNLGTTGIFLRGGLFRNLACKFYISLRGQDADLDERTGRVIPIFELSTIGLVVIDRKGTLNLGASAC